MHIFLIIIMCYFFLQEFLAETKNMTENMNREVTFKEFLIYLVTILTLTLTARGSTLVDRI